MNTKRGSKMCAMYTREEGKSDMDITQTVPREDVGHLSLQGPGEVLEGVLRDLSELMGVPAPVLSQEAFAMEDRSRVQYIVECMRSYVADLRKRVMRSHETEQLLKIALAARPTAAEQAYRGILQRVLQILPEELRPADGFPGLPAVIFSVCEKRAHIEDSRLQAILEDVRWTVPAPFRPPVTEYEKLPASLNAWAAHLNKLEHGGNGSHP